MDGGLRQIFRERLLDFDWVSIESGATGGGIPDSNYCSHGQEGWIEYKLTTGWTVPLRPQQVGWITRRVRNGGRVHIAVRQKQAGGPRSSPVDALWLLPGHGATLYKEHGLRAFVDGGQTFYGGPAGWDWRAIAALLTD
jgi:hypothetical protein